MPCNAVATARARVTNKTLVGMLTPEILMTSLKAVLTAEEYYGIRKSRIDEGYLFLGLASPSGPFDIIVEFQGDSLSIAVRPGWARAEKKAEELKALIEANAVKVANYVLTAKINARLKKAGASIKKSTTAPNGAQVVEFEIGA